MLQFVICPQVDHDMTPIIDKLEAVHPDARQEHNVATELGAASANGRYNNCANRYSVTKVRQMIAALVLLH